MNLLLFITIDYSVFNQSIA